MTIIPMSAVFLENRPNGLLSFGRIGSGSGILL